MQVPGRTQQAYSPSFEHFGIEFLGFLSELLEPQKGFRVLGLRVEGFRVLGAQRAVLRVLGPLFYLLLRSR